MSSSTRLGLGQAAQFDLLVSVNALDGC